MRVWDFEIERVAVIDDADADADDKKHKKRDHATPPPSAAPITSLTCVRSGELDLGEDVLAVRYTNDGRLLAVALLDHTVRVHFADTLKLFVSLVRNSMGAARYYFCGYRF